MKDFNELCCHKEKGFYGNDFYVVNNDVQINYLNINIVSNIFAKIALYCVENYETDGYYSIARAAWELENNGKIQIFARENGIDCSWTYDFYEKEGCKSPLECAKKMLGCDVEVIVENKNGRIIVDVYVRSEKEYLKKWDLNYYHNSFIASLEQCGYEVHHHKYGE